MHYVVGATVGLAVGVFCPSVARYLHARFSAEAAKGASLVEGAVADVKKKL